jgi:hypothetical protein
MKEAALSTMPVLTLVPLLASPYPTGHHISSSTHSDTVRSYGHALVRRAIGLLGIIKKCDSPPISLCAYSPSALSNIIVYIYKTLLAPSHLVKEGQLGWEMKKNEIPKKEMRRKTLSC